MSTPTLPLCTSPIEGGPVSTSVTNLLTFLIASHCALTIPSAWPENYGPTALENGLDSYDFVIIGTGPAGSVVGSRLSENPNVRVLMLEAGDDPPVESKIPAMFLATHRGSQVYEYETEPNPNACLGKKNSRCYWPIAKTVGGTGSIDHILSIRGNKEKFDEWNLPTWSWDDVSKYYDFSEQVRPDRGHVVLNKFDQYDTSRISDVIFKSFKELGIATTSFVTGNSRVNIGYTKGFLKNGERVGAGESYLSMVKSRPNIHIIKNAEASRVNFDGLTATSVTFMYNGEEMTVTATKEIILAAGAIGNPKLLMLSGIGPQEHLETHDIPVLVNLTGVGQNIQDTIGVVVPFQHKLNKAKSKNPKENKVDLFYYLSDKYGPLSTVGSLAQLGFINDERSCGKSVKGTCRYPDLNVIHFFSERNSGNLQLLNSAQGWSDEIVQSWGNVNTVANVLLTFLSLQNPESRGYIELQSNNYLDKVKVFANYLEDERDVESLLQGIKFQMDVEQTRAYKKADVQIFELNTPCSQRHSFKSDEFWRCYIRYMTTTIYAPAGTTKMGLDSDPLAVVDLRMNVRGVRSLRAVGSSIYPLTVTSVNTMVAVGERLAAFLKEEYSL